MGRRFARYALRFLPTNRPETELREVDVALPPVVSVVVVCGCLAPALELTNFPEMAERYCLPDLPRFFSAVSRS